MYTRLSQYYDQVFPTTPRKVRFLESLWGGETGPVLDIACGTGSLLKAFGAPGLGVDLDPEMIALADKTPHPLVQFMPGDMRSLPTQGPYRQVLCLGNSLAHLLTLPDLTQALKEMARVLDPRGTLVIQTVNYDRVLDLGVLTLPLIQTPEVRFERWYTHAQDHLNFHTRLTPAGEQASESAIPLYPWRRLAVEEVLWGLGLVVGRVFGDYTAVPWSLSNPSTILVAQLI